MNIDTLEFCVNTVEGAIEKITRQLNGEDTATRKVIMDMLDSLSQARSETQFVIDGQKEADALNVPSDRVRSQMLMSDYR